LLRAQVPYATVADLDRGHAILLRNPFQLQAVSYNGVKGWTDNPADWHDINFRSVTQNVPGGYDPTVLGAPGDYEWSILDYKGAYDLQPSARPYLPYLVGFQYLDEQDMTQQANIDAAKNYFATMHANPAFDHVAFFTNQGHWQGTVPILQNYNQQA